MQTCFVHISDLHFGQENGQALDCAAAFVAQVQPDAVIASGDLTALGARREMRQAFTWLRSLPAQVLATPGNHDTPYFDLLPRLFDPFRGFRKYSNGVKSDVWSDPRFVIVPINTARGVQWRKNWALGAVSPGQVHRACLALTAAPSDALKIVVTHHPLIWPENTVIPGDTRGGPAAFEKFCEAGADLFLSGHLHQTAIHAVERAGRLVYLASAGTLSVRYRSEGSSFLLIRRGSNNLLSFQRISVDGEGQAHTETSAVQQLLAWV